MQRIETIRVNGVDRALLTVPEACQVLNISRSHLYLLIAAGEIRAVHAGRSLRLPVSALREWLEAAPAAVQHADAA